MDKLNTWPNYSKDEINAVSRVLRCGKVNYWTGQEGKAFEREYADYTGVRHAIALTNGTAALELALRVLGVGPGDEVIVTPRSFIASASSIALVGATPVFVDVDRESQNITAKSIAPYITNKTRAIIAVHLAGWPCEMPSIVTLAKSKGISVIEDCAQAHGAKLAGQPVGSFGDISAFSFCQDKIISTGGEGGMLLTNSDELWEKAWAYKDHGKRYDESCETEDCHSATTFRWTHDSFGSNLRMTEMQAAIGRLQLRNLDEAVEKRGSNAKVLIEELSSIPILSTPVPKQHIRHAYYKFYTFLNVDALAPKWTRERIVAAIKDRAVPCSTGSYGELYKEKAFIDAGLGLEAPLPNALELGRSSLMFLVHPTLSHKEVAQMARTIKSVISSALS